MRLRLRATKHTATAIPDSELEALIKPNQQVFLEPSIVALTDFLNGDDALTAKLGIPSSAESDGWEVYSDRMSEVVARCLAYLATGSWPPADWKAPY